MPVNVVHVYGAELQTVLPAFPSSLLSLPQHFSLPTAVYERHSPPSLVPLHPSVCIFRGAWRYRVSRAEEPMRPSSCAAQSPEERERQEDSHSAASPPCTPSHHIQPRLLHTKANNAAVKAIVDIQHFLNSWTEWITWWPAKLGEGNWPGSAICKSERENVRMDTKTVCLFRRQWTLMLCYSTENSEKSLRNTHKQRN